VKDEHGRKLPFLRLAGSEVLRQLLAVPLVDVLERQEIGHGNLHLDNRLINLALEHFGRIEIGAALTTQTELQHFHQPTVAVSVILWAYGVVVTITLSDV